MHVGIVGASGYTGAELLRLVAAHPDLEVAWATADTQAGTAVADLYPSLAGAYDALTFTPYDPAVASGLDLVFLALPHGQSQRIVPELRGRVGAIVDLAADFRLRDAALYPRWYGEAHAAPELLDQFAYGLPELFRDDVATADAVAAPGCYPTAAALALAPLVREGVIEPAGIIVDAASGVSGAGRQPRPTTHFGTANEDFTAYGLLDHRHTPEIEQATGAQVLFTPHLAPMTRGILATCYARPSGNTSTAELLDLLRTAYAGEPFVELGSTPPGVRDVRETNICRISVHRDERSGRAIVFAAIDNLWKGAASQAVQNLNLMFGLPEGEGIS